MTDLEKALEEEKIKHMQRQALNEKDGHTRLIEVLIELGAEPLDTSKPFVSWQVTTESEAEVKVVRLNLLPMFEKLVQRFA